MNGEKALIKWVILAAFCYMLTGCGVQGSDATNSKGTTSQNNTGTTFGTITPVVSSVVNSNSQNPSVSELLKAAAANVTTQRELETYCGSYYSVFYPMTWGYFEINTEDPFAYSLFYQAIWGDLQEYRGDGIPFDTLSRYEKSLVDYPTIGAYIYFSSASSNVYHSTNYCFTLLKSTPIRRAAQYRYMYTPCSKCVGE